MIKIERTARRKYRWSESTLYSNELHRFQSFQNQLQNQLHSLQTQLQSFLTRATKSLEAALKKPRYTHEPDSNKQSPSYLLGIPATPMAYFLTPPPTVEHPERHWHTGDTDMNESDSNKSEKDRPDETDVDKSYSDKSEREPPDETDVEGTDLGKTEGEEHDDTDLNESDSAHSLPGMNFTIHKELEHSKRIISETYQVSEGCCLL